MKIFNGTDIIEIFRIKEDIENYGEKFLKRVYTEKEINYCESKRINKYESYAVRFAAKEAVYKAISKKINMNCDWQNIEIVNDENGRPEVKLKVEIRDLEYIEISLSHSKEYAVANCIAVFKEID